MTGSTLPNSLTALLEAPLTEELYLDWASLLETIVPNYAPTATHLLICMTLLVHPKSQDGEVLRAQCHRILLKTFARYGCRPFRQVLSFESDGLGRSKRRKTRHPIEELENVLADEEITEISLATSESICKRFYSLWHLFGCAFSKTDANYFWWLQLVRFLCDILEADWQISTTEKLDLSKTLLVQCLRKKNDKDVKLKEVLKYVLANPLKEDWSVSDPLEEENAQAREPSSVDVNASFTCMGAMNSERRRILTMIYRISQIDRLNVLADNEMTSNLANLLAPMSLTFVIDLFNYGRNNGNDSLVVVFPSLLNALLFRLATFPVNSRKGGERTVDWSKVQGWCASESRGSDAIEILKVELFKYILLVTFTSSSATEIDAEEKRETVNTLLQTLHQAEERANETLRSQTDDQGVWKYLSYGTPEEIRECFCRLNLLAQLQIKNTR